MRKRRLRIRVRTIPVLFTTDQLRSIGKILNLSKRGVFVRALDLPAVGASICVSFKDLQGQKVEVSGEVGWTTDRLKPGECENPGFGVRFTEWNSAYHEFLEQMLFSRTEPN